MSKLFPARLIPVLALGLTGCGGGKGEWNWIWSLGGSLTLGGLKWAVLCGFLGLLIAGPVYWILKRSGALHAEWKVAKLFRFLALVGLLIVFPIAFGYGGFFEGVLRATEHELTEGRVAKEIYPAVGGVGADYIGAVLLASESADSSLAAFQTGQKEIVASTIPETLARVESEYLDEFAEEAKKRARETLPVLREGTGAQILDWFVDHCGEGLAQATVGEGDESDDGGSVVRLFRDFIRGLPKAALLEGAPETLSHTELSRFIVEATLAKGTIQIVVKPFCRGHQVGALLIILGAVLAPIFVLRIPPLFIRWLERRKKMEPEEERGAG